MDCTTDFLQLVERICRRPGMFVYGSPFYEVCAYLSGYAAASPDSPLYGDGGKAFSAFVCATYRFPDKYTWPYVLKLCSRDDDEAIARLRDLLTEFAHRAKTQSHAEIVRDVVAKVNREDEGEPEKTWRRFSRALLRGKREDIEPLIQEHPDAGMLWSGACPEEVALAFDQIADRYPVSQIPGRGDDANVTLITSEFGPIPLKRIKGSWRIDAATIINARKANRSRAARQGADAGGEDSA